VIKKFTVELAETQNMRAITFVSINPSVPTSEVSQKIKEMNGVEVVYETTGEFDIIAVIIGTNIAEINRVIEEIRRIPGVIDTNTSIILRTIR
jgi:DNA-binding Lrp family transcriptional regulator